MFGAPDEVFRGGVPDGQRRILYHLKKKDRQLKVSMKTLRKQSLIKLRRTVSKNKPAIKKLQTVNLVLND